MEFFGFYLLAAGVWTCAAIGASLLWLYLIDQRKDTQVADTLQKVADVPNQIIKAADNVIETGLQEEFDVHFTVFGRKIGVKVQVSLLSKGGN